MSRNDKKRKQEVTIPFYLFENSPSHMEAVKYILSEWRRLGLDKVGVDFHVSMYTGEDGKTYLVFRFQFMGADGDGVEDSSNFMRDLLNSKNKRVSSIVPCMWVNYLSRYLRGREKGHDSFFMCDGSSLYTYSDLEYRRVIDNLFYEEEVEFSEQRQHMLEFIEEQKVDYYHFSFESLVKAKNGRRRGRRKEVSILFSDAELKEFQETILTEHMLAFAMASHPRLGNSSCAGSLSTELVDMIIASCVFAAGKDDKDWLHRFEEQYS